MTIREGLESDIPMIVELLKLSLGESLMPKSEAFWRWKHVENPFGPSPVLLAFERDRLIGVRAFMRWQWKLGKRIIRSARPVDTATHPEYQGKGIFRELTMRLVEKCRVEEIDLIFNTPNSKSRPGYLKLGWAENGRMRLFISPRRTLSGMAADFDSAYRVGHNRISWIDDYQDATPSSMVSLYSTRQLNWRYAENPNIPYYSFSDSSTSPSYLTIFRLKTHRWGTEFRICDSWRTSDSAKPQHHKKLLNVFSASGATILTCSESQGLFPGFAFPVGPEITTLPLSLDRNVLTFNIWKPSMGDMEVF